MAHRFSRSEKGKWTAAPVLAKRPPLRIPASNNNELIAANKLTLIGRVTNPILQRIRAVVDFFPQIWNLEGRVEGRELGPEKFQMRFLSEEDLERVLSKGPNHYKRWMLILQKWEPIISESFTSKITFWVRIHDIPLHFWNEQTITTIGEDIGPMSGKVLEEAKVRVEVDGFHPLMMDMEIQLPSEEIISVEFEYIKIEKHCFTCFSLLHEEINCPIRDRNAPPLRIGSWVSLNGWLSNALKLIKEDMMIEEATNAQPLKIDSTLLAMRINTTDVNNLIIETFPYLIGMLLH